MSCRHCDDGEPTPRQLKTENESLRQALVDAERDMRGMAKLLKLHIEVAARTAEIEPAEFEGYDTATQILGKDRGEGRGWTEKSTQ
jgi:hypothetical protein